MSHSHGHSHSHGENCDHEHHSWIYKNRAPILYAALIIGIGMYQTINDDKNPARNLESPRTPESPLTNIHTNK